MLEISPYLFLGLMLAVLIGGFAGGLAVLRIVLAPMVRAMKATNDEYTRQLGIHGQSWVTLFEHQEQQLNYHRSVAMDADRRFYTAMRMLVGPQKGSMNEVADQLLVQPRYGGEHRARRIPARTPAQEAQLARQARINLERERTIVAAQHEHGMQEQGRQSAESA